MRVFCEICNRDITDKQEYICDKCGRIVCDDCSSGDFNIVCKECELED